ncbi:MAG TPA: AraC family transcriptional regulator [Pyrinomonadaceae bacterium]|nr:AraC family transcriptional regulator [Pyrinomonadaceae bacterium]
MNTVIKVQHKVRQSTLIDRRRAIERVIKSVSLNLGEPLTMEEMAKMAYMSPFHFNRVFHQVTGLPPAQFLYAMRLEKAKCLLLTTKMSVTNICFEVGYNSVGTFTSRFTELVGLSPREYRRLAKQIRLFDWKHLFREGWQPENEMAIEPFVKGKIFAPKNFEGLIFVGLFEQMIPQNRPVAGTMLTRGGSFCLSSLLQGDYFLMAAALPRAEDALEYLLPDFSKLLVGVRETPLHIQSANDKESIKIELRPFAVTDPPILLALPNLLADGISKLQSKMDGRDKLAIWKR